MRKWIVQISQMFRQSGRSVAHRSKRVSFRPMLEALEERRVLSTYTVTNTLTSGPGSFAQAILNANAHAGLDDIDFAIGTGAVKIEPTTALPTITDAVYINGTSQPGWSGDPLIELDGAHINANSANGLLITGGGSTVRGLVINNFSGAAIEVEQKGGNVIAGDYLGTSLGGTVAKGNEWGVIIRGSSDNTVGGLEAADRNLISGSTAGGVLLFGNSTTNGKTTGNVIEGNYIGTDKSGTGALGNVDAGVELFEGADQNTIGGVTFGARNVISGNDGEGITINNASNGNFIEGNYIGTDKTGEVALGNASTDNDYNGFNIDAGIEIGESSLDNTIGGTASGAGNVISGNAANGIVLAPTGVRSDSSGNVIEGNYIGTDSSGTAALANTNDGIVLYNVDGNTIGGTTSAARNVISGNGSSGVYLRDIGLTGNVVEGNFIGTDKTGSGPLGNAADGVYVNGTQNTIGGSVDADRNVISGNTGVGVALGGSEDNLIQHNDIGVAKDGVTALGNGSDGVFLSGSDSNEVLSNNIGFNGGDGVDIASTTENPIRFNLIFNNGGLGIFLAAGANNSQSSPTFTAADSGGVTTVTGSLTSAANEVFSLQFFFGATAASDAQSYTGTTFSVTTNSSGVASFSQALGVLVPDGDFVTATAQDHMGDTSELSAAVAVQ